MKKWSSAVSKSVTLAIKTQNVNTRSVCFERGTRRQSQFIQDVETHLHKIMHKVKFTLGVWTRTIIKAHSLFFEMMKIH